MDPDFEIGNEGDSEAILKQIWNSFILDELRNQGEEFLDLLTKEEIDLNKLFELVESSIKYQDIEILSMDCGRPTEDEATDVFVSIKKPVEKLKEFLPRFDKAKLARTDQKKKKYILDLVSAMDAVEAGQFNALRFLLEHQPVEEKWSPKQQADIAEVDSEIMQSITSFQNLECTWIHNRIVQIIEAFRTFYNSEKKRTSSLGFDDLLFQTNELLKNNKEVRAYFKKKYDRLFVDEVQDNDPLQTEIMFFLCERDRGAATNWREVALQPGKLFMVGDPKQSIYRFRRADIQVYEEAKNIIAVQDGILCELTTNFRSTEPIVNFINRHFARSFVNYSKAIEKQFHPHYIPLDINPEKEILTEVPLYINLTSKVAKTEAEATKTAGFIRMLKAGKKFDFKDVLILFRGRNNMSTYADIFQKAGIPLYEVGQKEYFTIQEVRALVSALEAIDDPTDSISLYSALRSPVFGLSDKELFAAFSGKGGVSLFSDLKDDTPGSPGAALRGLRELFDRKNTLRPSGVLKGILDLTGLTGVLLESRNGEQNVSQVFRLVEMLHEYEQDLSLTFSGVIRQLRLATESESTRLGTIHITPGSANAVRFMTIHQAKGLQSPVVILADSIKERNQNRDSTHYIVKNDDGGKLILPYKKCGFGGLDPENVIDEDKLKSESEEERLRYVAATRASDVLMICIAAETNYAHNEPFRASIIGDNSQPAAGIELFDTGIEPNDRTGDEETLDLDVAYAEQKGKQKTNLASIKENSEKINSFFRNVHAEMDIPKDVYSHPGRVPLGKEFGSLVHKLMEYHVTIPGFDPDTVIDRLIDDFEVKPSHKTTALAYYKAFTEHPLVINAINSPEKFCEWEFFTKQPDGSLLTGVIDLVYKNPDGTWTIVDYKTDDVSDPGYRSRIDPLYQQQIELYKKSFEAVTGNYVSNAKVIYNE
ncbi:MAG: hypothetical protein HBSAPP04_22110 [Ignavibacteriaceae bacterium]|nr:MAG: hypothetical protein HBSAPP04_22110 [Ignavibacteriaceae bacterium]